ncbi:LysR substrate-binding domain-containing protein [Pseudomonas sp. LB-090624]|uniref:LysR substrate-binding domain-containing protein n=1 Tax=Pseudomonas sp. LB-090624 TaxID=2213079 RepID=UPI001C437A51|nr:LysR substrate-binding domain-containing protein [Pseudomonas sp. LB-090624]
MRNFVVCVDSGSLSKAAVALAISQPSLSQQIAEMESDFGMPLLTRSHAGVVPTEAGLTLYRHAQSILKQVVQMRSEMKTGVHALSGRVAVGMPSSISSSLAIPLFERVRSLHPGIRMEFFDGMSGYLQELLAVGTLDFAVLLREEETRDVTVIPLFTERLAVLGVPWVGNANDPCVALEAMSGVPLVLPGRTNGLRLLIERVFDAEGLELNVVADINSLPAMIEIAQRGEAATLLPGYLGGKAPVGDSDRPPHVLSRYLTNPTLERCVSLCRLNSVPQTAAAKAVQACLVHLVGELAPGIPGMAAAIPLLSK